MSSRAGRAVLAGCALALALSACDGVPTSKGDKLADSVSSTLEKQGRKVEDVTCPDLKGDKGKKVTCKAKQGGKTYPVIVTATGFNGHTVSTKIDGSKVPQG